MAPAVLTRQSVITQPDVEWGQRSVALMHSHLHASPQEMAGRALKQTGSRSIEAALEFISKMGYLDPRNEQIVRVIKQTSPGEPQRQALVWQAE